MRLGSYCQTVFVLLTTAGLTFGQDSILSIAEVKTIKAPDIDAQTNVTIKVGIRRRPNVGVDCTKVKIQVFFYDLVNDREIKLTDADVNPEWETPNHDWNETDTEILKVNYLRSKRGPTHKGENKRVYLGY